VTEAFAQGFVSYILAVDDYAIKSKESHSILVGISLLFSCLSVTLPVHLVANQLQVRHQIWCHNDIRICLLLPESIYQVDKPIDFYDQPIRIRLGYQKLDSSVEARHFSHAIH